jgi:simple sugar transport system permease protein
MGFFVAGALVFWLVLNRTTLGSAGARGRLAPGGALRRDLGGAELLPRGSDLGRLRRPPGVIDILGWQTRINTSDVQIVPDRVHRHRVALLGRNTAVGVGLAALLFAALTTGTSTRNLDPEIFRPELASNLTTTIQGLVILFLGADVLILYLLNLRKRGRRRAATRPQE